MRDTFEWIDEAATANSALRHALYDLAAHHIASQAFTLACASRAGGITADDAAGFVEQVAGYPGVTSRQMLPDSESRVGARATEILIGLAKLRTGFFKS